MHSYFETVLPELRAWQKQMNRSPSAINSLAKKIQDRINKIIPEKLHKAITKAIKEMVRGYYLAQCTLQQDLIKTLGSSKLNGR